MPKKCCLYEKGSLEKQICTTQANCPTLTGWTPVGSWEVEDCDDCWGEQMDFKVPPYLEWTRWIKELEKLIVLGHWFIMHWDEIFPENPLGPKIGNFDKIEPILKSIRNQKSI